jgi:hypothetical protein
MLAKYITFLRIFGGKFKKVAKIATMQTFCENCKKNLVRLEIFTCFVILVNGRGGDRCDQQSPLHANRI